MLGLRGHLSLVKRRRPDHYSLAHRATATTASTASFRRISASIAEPPELAGRKGDSQDRVVLRSVLAAVSERQAISECECQVKCHVK